MLKFLFILIGFLSFFNISAQQVTNMAVTQEGDNVVITYDISSDKTGQTFDIKVECSTDNGKTFSITPLSITGDLKEVSTGNGKRIVWDVLSEGQELTGDKFVFQLALSNSNSGNSGTFTDPRDGHVYKWVKIGTQIWMAENLSATKYNDGTAIPNVTDNTKWGTLKTPSYCYYNNGLIFYNTYGALYNWYTVNTGNLAPIGWHVPTDAEWTILTTHLRGGDYSGGEELKESSTIYWIKSNTGATNTSGFMAFPSGFWKNCLWKSKA